MTRRTTWLLVGMLVSLVFTICVAHRWKTEHALATDSIQPVVLRTYCTDNLTPPVHLSYHEKEGVITIAWRVNTVQCFAVSGDAHLLVFDGWSVGGNLSNLPDLNFGVVEITSDKEDYVLQVPTTIEADAWAATVYVPREGEGIVIRSRWSILLTPRCLFDSGERWLGVSTLLWRPDHKAPGS